MLVDRYEAEDVFAPVPQMAARIDPVLSKLDQLLDDDEPYQRVRADSGKRHRWTTSSDATARRWKCCCAC
jgi:hypothetical protein